MIILKLQGGLGNQMFQYAFGRCLSQRKNDELLFDKSFLAIVNVDSKRRFRLGVFCARVKIANTYDIAKILELSPLDNLLRRFFPSIFWYKGSEVREKGHFFDKTVFDSKGDLYLSGFWQSEKYFSDIEDIIRKDFKFKKKFRMDILEIEKEISNSNSVSIHVRRGDYVTNPGAANFNGFIGVRYYKKAVDLINKKVTNPRYFVFSDDIRWCKDNLNFIKDAVFVNSHKDYEDMFLMSKCKHNIIANSSYSWWGAWLNTNPQKKVVAPKRWFVDYKPTNKDIVPKTWISI